MAVLAVRRPRDAAALRRAGVGAGVRRLVLALGGEQIVAVAALVVDVDAPRFLGIAILRVLMAARLALGGGGVAAVRRMLPVMVTKPCVRLTLYRERLGGAKAQAQGQSGDDTQNSAFHSKTS